MANLIILFFVTFSAALLGVVPPGLINLNAAKISTHKGKLNGIIFAGGASIVVVLQAYLAVLISKYLHNNTFIIDALLKVAVIVFALFAIYFFVIARKNKKKRIRVVKVSKKSSFFKGIFLAMLNVLPIPYFAGLCATWNYSELMVFEIIDIIVFVLGAGLGTFAMLYMYVFYFDKLQSNTSSFSKYSDYILSVLMLILLVITLARIVYT